MSTSENEIKDFLARYNKLRAEMDSAYTRYGPMELSRILKMSAGSLANWKSRGWPLKPETLAQRLRTLIAHEKKMNQQE